MVTHQAIKFCALIVILQKVILEYAHIKDQVDEKLPNKDPKKARAKKASWYSRNAKKVKARSSKRYYEKRDEILEGYKEDREKNPKKWFEIRKKYRERNPQHVKDLRNTNYAKHAERNRPRVNKRANKLNHERKEIVYTHYSKKLSNSDVPCCNCCEYTGIDFLNVDHIIPKREMEKDPKMIEMGFKASRKAHSLNGWLITNNFPKGFQILCWNCNFAKDKLGKCPHQNRA